MQICHGKGNIQFRRLGTVQKEQTRMFEVWIVGFMDEFEGLCKAATDPIF